MNLKSSNQENQASPNKENGYSDQFGAVITINNTVDGKQRSREFMRTIYTDVRSKTTRITGSGTKPVELGGL